MEQHALVFASTACLGGFLTAVVSVAMEFGTRICPRVDEGIVAGVYNSFAQAGGCIFVWVGSALLEIPTWASHIVFIGALVCSAVLLEVGIGSRRLPLPVN